MSHLWQEVMRRVLAGECGAQEAEHAADHLVPVANAGLRRRT
jgi:hypothetical protein